MCVNNLPKVVTLTAERPVVELATSRVASQRPNHYTTRPHSLVWLFHKFCENPRTTFCVILPTNTRKDRQAMWNYEALPLPACGGRNKGIELTTRDVAVYIRSNSKQ